MVVHVITYIGVHSITANLPTNIVDFKGLDSSIVLIQRGGILMSIGDFPESLSRAMLVGIILVRGLGARSEQTANIIQFKSHNGNTVSAYPTVGQRLIKALSAVFTSMVLFVSDALRKRR